MDVENILKIRIQSLPSTNNKTEKQERIFGNCGFFNCFVRSNRNSTKRAESMQTSEQLENEKQRCSASSGFGFPLIVSPEHLNAQRLSSKQIHSGTKAFAQHCLQQSLLESEKSDHTVSADCLRLEFARTEAQKWNASVSARCGNNRIQFQNVAGRLRLTEALVGRPVHAKIMFRLFHLL